MRLSVINAAKAARNWYHAGEEEAVAVYSKNMAPIIIVQAGLLVIFWFVLRAAHCQFVIPIVSLFIFPRALAESRRAIIFSRDEVIERPTLGSLRRVRLTMILRAERISTIQSYGLRPMRCESARLRLTDLSEHIIRLDVDHGQEVFDRLEAAPCQNGGV